MLQIRLLGGFEVRQEEISLPGLSPQPRRLLALLTLKADHRIEINRLWRDLWPESDDAAVVRMNLHRLRKALGLDAYRLSVETGTVCLDLNGVEVDIAVFASLVE